jgi:hypothetical protein
LGALTAAGSIATSEIGAATGAASAMGASVMYGFRLREWD